MLDFRLEDLCLVRNWCEDDILLRIFRHHLLVLFVLLAVGDLPFHGIVDAARWVLVVQMTIFPLFQLKQPKPGRLALQHLFRSGMLWTWAGRWSGWALTACIASQPRRELSSSCMISSLMR
jgi:hypothetical protein